MFGIHNQKAIYYANLHDKLLESRKNGYYLLNTLTSNTDDSNITFKEFNKN
jgi:hypothetical protein